MPIFVLSESIINVMNRKMKFDIALSFAGEDRVYVSQVAALLKSQGISVFYDLYEEENLWGKNLYDYLSDVYQNQAIYTIMFISASYKQKMWTNLERQAMQARAFQENQEYILPAKFDDTEITGVLSTVGYIDLRTKTPEQFAKIIERKLVYGGRTIPSENLRKTLSTITILPKIESKSIHIMITDIKTNIGINQAQIVLSAENGTYLDTLTNQNGIGKIEIKTRKLYSLLIAHPNYFSVLIQNIDLETDIQIQMKKVENIGSLIIQSTGYIPGLNGQLAPIYDTLHRMYLYANNIAINGGRNQPVDFELNNIIEVEDNQGTIMNLIFRYINGHTTALIDYIKPTRNQ